MISSSYEINTEADSVHSPSRMGISVLRTLESLSPLCKSTSAHFVPLINKALGCEAIAYIEMYMIVHCAVQAVWVVVGCEYATTNASHRVRVRRSEIAAEIRYLQKYERCAVCIIASMSRTCVI